MSSAVVQVADGGFNSLLNQNVAIPNYRIYSLDERGHIVVGIDVVCADDCEAIELAMARLVGPNHFEIWEGSRLVRALPARGHSCRPTQTPGTPGTVH
jgi:hypothetical protein